MLWKTSLYAHISRFLSILFGYLLYLSTDEYISEENKKRFAAKLNIFYDYSVRQYQIIIITRSI